MEAAESRPSKAMRLMDAEFYKGTRKTQRVNGNKGAVKGQ